MTERSIDLNAPLAGVVYEKSEGIARITLDRPERGNALTPAMHGLFHALWTDVREDPNVRVAIVAARGERHFCTGFDVAEAEADDADEVFSDGPLAESVLWSPYQNKVWKPVICVVNGLCVAGPFHEVGEVLVLPPAVAGQIGRVHEKVVGAHLLDEGEHVVGELSELTQTDAH